MPLPAPYYAYVYFVQMGDAGPVKIGWAGNPEKRVTALQTGSPYPLEVRALIKTRRPGVDEAAIHEALSEHRMGGEWFEPHADVLAFIERRGELEGQLLLRSYLGNDADRRRLIADFLERLYVDWTDELAGAIGGRAA